jgi:hypothetical protein
MAAVLVLVMKSVLANFDAAEAIRKPLALAMQSARGFDSCRLRTEI